jgi:ADP-ribose pyrophosphatase YjhB (NUDIX family)
VSLEDPLTDPMPGFTVPLTADAVRLLGSWTAPDAGQAALREAFLQHLATVPDGIWRTGRPDHLTASALVLSADRRRVLLDLHGKVGRWLQFGGHLEPDDSSVAAAALREAHEESGVAGLRLLPGGPARLDRHRAPCSPGSARDHLDVQFVAVAPPDAVPTASSESINVAWWDVDALPDTDDSVRRLVKAALAR